MNELTVFNFNGEEVRTVIVNDKPYFVAKDVCDILDIQNVSQAINGNQESGATGLDEDEKLTYKIYISGQNRDVLLVNESGVYSLIFKSNKPEAKVFKKWVTSEVLPSIRKTGKYEKEPEKDVEKKDLINVIKRMSNQIVETNKFLLNYFGHKQTDDEIWISTQELLELANYKSKGNVTYHSKKEGWICRPIAGKPQHYEYKLESLPVDIQTKFYEKYNKDE
ncbi:MAG TPA: Bro-N domain-containing protein [Spirochaetota bacterium]|nr:Bro-N domain-containing protein [Spirochaetota bacterium]